MIKVGPFVFRITGIVSAEEMIRIREEIIRQMNEGVALLPSYVELLYHPGMTELAEAAKDHERLC